MPHSTIAIRQVGRNDMIAVNGYDERRNMAGQIENWENGWKIMELKDFKLGTKPFAFT